MAPSPKNLAGGPQSGVTNVLFSFFSLSSPLIPPPLFFPFLFFFFFYFSFSFLFSPLFSFSFFFSFSFLFFPFLSPFFFFFFFFPFLFPSFSLFSSSFFFFFFSFFFFWGLSFFFLFFFFLVVFFFSWRLAPFPTPSPSPPSLLSLPFSLLPPLLLNYLASPPLDPFHIWTVLPLFQVSVGHLGRRLLLIMPGCVLLSEHRFNPNFQPVTTDPQKRLIPPPHARLSINLPHRVLAFYTFRQAIFLVC